MKHLPLILILALVACREDPAQASKRGRQTRRIVELERQVDKIRADMSTPLKETAKDVTESLQMADETEAYVREKEEELLALESELETARKDHEAYRRRYVVEDWRAKDKP
ncbi:hypothetical protein [Luteolibacter sp. Populi]|uniref:hypothetical protein n=1 Tax=Luteolibacter sp. Populi TaxID=3230487 RepID=UPI00346643C8